MQTKEPNGCYLVPIELYIADVPSLAVHHCFGLFFGDGSLTFLVDIKYLTEHKTLSIVDCGYESLYSIVRLMTYWINQDQELPDMVPDYWNIRPSNKQRTCYQLYWTKQGTDICIQWMGPYLARLKIFRAAKHHRFCSLYTQQQNGDLYITCPEFKEAFDHYRQYGKFVQFVQREAQIKHITVELTSNKIKMYAQKWWTLFKQKHPTWWIIEFVFDKDKENDVIDISWDSDEYDKYIANRTPTRSEQLTWKMR